MATLIEERIALSPALTAATAHVAAGLRAGTVEVRVEGHGNGSGVIWQADGLIVTNHHVARADHMEVVLEDGRLLKARVTARDPERDLAALRVEANDLPAMTIGDSTALRVGQIVLAMGNPLGIKGALTIGIIHALAPLASGRDSRQGRWIQADLSLAPGNSGGPMADAQGRVIGINSMVAGGLALAIPSKSVERFVHGDATVAFLGVSVQAVELPAQFAQAAGQGQKSGLLVLTTEEGGPAAQAGLLPGDILLTAGSWTFAGTRDLLSFLREATANSPATLAILRAGEPREVQALLGERTQEPR